MGKNPTNKQINLEINENNDVYVNIRNSETANKAKQDGKIIKLRFSSHETTFYFNLYII